MNAAVLVIRNSDCAVRGYLGGTGYLAAEGARQFDHLRGIRSPGSALKPVIYGLGFEDLIVHPLTLTTDQPVQFDELQESLSSSGRLREPRGVFRFKTFEEFNDWKERYHSKGSKSRTSIQPKGETFENR